MKLWKRIKCACRVLFGSYRAVLVFKFEPTEGDTITVGRMFARFNRGAYFSGSHTGEPISQVIRKPDGINYLKK